MQTTTTVPRPNLRSLTEPQAPGLAATLSTAPVSSLDVAAVVVTQPEKKPFSYVDSLNREIAILNTVQPLALLGCAVAYGATQAINPNSWGEALVCLAPFVMGIGGPFLAAAVESKRRAWHQAHRNR